MSLEFSPGFFLNFSEREMIGELAHSYQFESFRLDVKERQLLKQGVPIPLTPKAFDLLEVLVRNSGHLLGKDELLRLVWADSFVEEANISRIVHTLRRALGKEDHGTRFIETVARKGYRFVAEVTKEVGSNEPSVVNGPRDHPIDEYFPDTIHVSEDAVHVVRQPVATASRTQQVSSRYLLFGFGFVTAIALLVVLSFEFWPGASVGGGKARTFAVLPLKPINSAIRDEFYENGVADAVIQSLNSINGFIVRPLSATRRYSEIGQDPLLAGREQKADYVLASNYQIADGKIRLTSQLINVATGEVEEPFSFEKDAASLFAVQDAVASEVSNKLIVRFGRVRKGTSASQGTSSEEAYRFYLQAMGLLDGRQSKRALDNLDQALTLDPKYALAWAGKALAHRAAVNLNRNADISGEYQRSMAAIEKAVSLDPNISDAYSALCENKFQFEWDAAGAEGACKRALEIDQNSSTAHRTYSWFLSSQGRSDESIAHIKTAIDLEPVSFNNQRFLAHALYLARSYDEAAVQYKRVIELDEEDGATYNWLIRTLEMHGNEAEAFDWFIRSLSMRSEDKGTIQHFKDVYQRSGWRGVMLERLRSTGDGDANPFRLACMNAVVGEKDRAFEYLEKAYQQRGQVTYLLQVEPELNSLRDDPRYAEMVKRLRAN